MHIRNKIVNFATGSIVVLLSLFAASGTVHAGGKYVCVAAPCNPSVAYAPSAPTLNFGAAPKWKCVTAPCQEAVVLEWAANPAAEQVTTYELYSNNQLVTTLQNNQASFSYKDTVVGSSATFTYTVRAISANGSTDSNALVYTTKYIPDNIAPSAPTHLTYEEVIIGDWWGLRLHWNAATDNIGVTRYEVIRMDNNSRAVAGYSVPANQTTYDDLLFHVNTGADINYTYEVIAYDASENSSQPSNEVYYPQQNTLSVQTVTVGPRWGARLDWSVLPNTEPVDYYTVERTDSSSSTPATFVVRGDQRTYDDLMFGINTGADTTFYYTVKAYDVYGNFLYMSNTAVFNSANQLRISKQKLTKQLYSTIRPR
jgi:hypothetical protein